MKHIFKIFATLVVGFAAVGVASAAPAKTNVGQDGTAVEVCNGTGGTLAVEYDYNSGNPPYTWAYIDPATSTNYTCQYFPDGSACITLDQLSEGGYSYAAGTFCRNWEIVFLPGNKHITIRK